VAAETGRRVKRMLLRQGLIVAQPHENDTDAPPRHALVRYAGVLAPASKWRPLVVPAAPAKACEHDWPQARAPAAGDVPATRNTQPKPIDASAGAAPPAPTPPHPSGSALPATRATNPFAYVDNAKPQPTGPGKLRGRRSTSYIDWASLMKRSMNIDVLACPKCHHGRMRPIADITDQEVIDKIMTHLRLPLVPEVLGDGAVVYDITGEPVLDRGWRPDGSDRGTTERGPPHDWEGIDAPAPDG
jgi:hypothetical protein